MNPTPYLSTILSEKRRVFAQLDICFSLLRERLPLRNRRFLTVIYNRHLPERSARDALREIALGNFRTGREYRKDEDVGLVGWCFVSCSLCYSESYFIGMFSGMVDYTPPSIFYSLLPSFYSAAAIKALDRYDTQVTNYSWRYLDQSVHHHSRIP